jgi:hypothetical protein
VAALATGLVLYFIDAPSKSAYFLKDPPDAALDGIRRPTGIGRLNLYFVLLDQGVPAGIRARALYMGSMYRIGYEAIHLIAISALGVSLAATTFEIGPHAHCPITSGARTIWITGAGLQVIPLILGIYFDDRRARNVRYQGRDEHRPRDIPRELGLAGVAGLLGAAAVVTYLIFPSVPRELAFGGVVLAATAWMRRYFRGYGERNPVGNPIGRSTASVLYCLAVVPAGLLAGVPHNAATGLGAGLAVGWSGMLLLAHALIISRGHEKRLGGSYQTQKTWLQLTFDELKESVESGTLTHLSRSSDTSNALTQPAASREDPEQQTESEGQGES